MALLIGAFLATSIVFGLLCLLFRGNRKFILIGFITWFICAFLYGFGYDSGWFIGFCFGLLLYLWGAALWTILALYFVKKNKNIKIITKYIPIISFTIQILVFAFMVVFSASVNMSKQNLVYDDVNQMITQVRTIFDGYNDYSNVNNVTIFTAMDMPNKNPYGGEYIIMPFPDDPNFFVIGITNLPNDICEHFLSATNLDTSYIIVADPENCTGELNDIYIVVE